MCQPARARDEAAARTRPCAPYSGAPRVLGSRASPYDECANEMEEVELRRLADRCEAFAHGSPERARYAPVPSLILCAKLPTKWLMAVPRALHRCAPYSAATSALAYTMSAP